MFSPWTGKLDWWQTGIVYQIYPRSFQDSDGDGIGDLKGVLSRLDHLEYLGVEIIWLSPIYSSPMVDFGYDVSDFTAIEPMFGTLQDFDDLVKAVHSKGMKLVMDYIPNHSSSEHSWFQASRRRQDPYKDYYIWQDGKVSQDGTREPPNNWLSVFSGPAWTWDEVRQQYYYHAYDPSQPDLNWRNPNVRKDMQGVFRFWLDRGVDGFRVDALGNLFEAEHLKDEPLSGEKGSPDRYSYLDHIYTYAQEETLDVVSGWRTFFDEYEKQTGRDHIFLVVEMYDWELTDCLKFYSAGADMPFNFNLIQIKQNSSARDINQWVQKWLKMMPEGKWPNWVLGNHDNHRIASRKGEKYVDVLNMLLLLLPGTPTTYQGEEIGMKNIHLTYEQTVDPEGKNAGPARYLDVSRDLCRSPLQWDNTSHSGFTRSTPWLPVHPEYKTNNVQVQKSDQNGESHLQIYKKLVTLRKHDSFKRGGMRCVVTTNDVISFLRHSSGQPSFLVALNVGNETSTDDHSGFPDFSSEVEGVVVIAVGGSGSCFIKGDKVNLQSLKLAPGEGVVLEIQM